MKTANMINVSLLVTFLSHFSFDIIHNNSLGSLNILFLDCYFNSVLFRKTLNMITL